ncbi:MAG TPA: hypothetical protein VGJ55_11395 [Pyrinomonadaceae bacterium]|jgi:hypothetical protein
MKKKVVLALIAGLWLLLIAVGVRTLMRYEHTSGDPGNPPATWPSQSQIQRSAGLPALVMLVHPQCACSRASIGELEMLMTRAQGRVKTYVLFLKPVGFPGSWETTDLWDSAARIPGVTVLRDDDGKEATIFHAATSGQTMLYSADGQLLFSGGITGSRGHLGDNDGYDSILSLIGQGAPEETRTKVFGCPLHDSGPRSKHQE